MPDLIGVGVLTAAFPPELVDLAIDEWDAREERVRMLPARLMRRPEVSGQGTN